MALYTAPTSNFFSTTLNGAIDNSVTTITLNSVTGLQSPGILIINREDGNGVATPNSREFISYTGISGSDLTGVTREVDGSTARAHSDGSLVEATVAVGMWNDLRTYLLVGHATDGTHDMTKINDSNANEVIQFGETASAVNDVTVTNAATGDAPTITATGGDTNIDLSLGGKGTGKVKVNSKYGDITADSDGATITFNLATTNLHTVTLEGNRTLALSNWSVGQAFIIRLVQDGTGSRTVTWFSTIKWVYGTAPTLTTTADKTDVFGFLCTSAGNYDGYIVGQNL